jgi:hypothetical protein
VGDAGIDYPGTLNGTCNAAGINDGTCAAVPGQGLNAPGICLQAGGTSIGACGAFVRCDPSEMCETDWACYGSVAGPGGNCIQLCDASGANTCPAGESCELQSDEETGNCVAAAAADGGALCDTTTCTGCPSGQTCMCISLTGTGTVACTVGSLACDFLGTALPGMCE